MTTPAKYKTMGLTLTPQRLAILEYLEGNTSHPSADDIYQAVSGKFPTMSLATVYNTLAALRSRGALVELTLDGDKKRYDPDISDHHHAICDSCKRISDLPAGSIQAPAGNMPGDFHVLKSSVEVHGICADCRPSQKERT